MLSVDIGVVGIEYGGHSHLKKYIYREIWILQRDNGGFIVAGWKVLDGEWGDWNWKGKLYWFGKAMEFGNKKLVSHPFFQKGSDRLD